MNAEYPLENYRKKIYMLLVPIEERATRSSGTMNNSVFRLWFASNVNN